METLAIIALVQILDPFRLIPCAIIGAKVRSFPAALAWSLGVSLLAVFIVGAIRVTGVDGVNYLAGAISGPLIAAFAYWIASIRRKKKSAPPT